MAGTRLVLGNLSLLHLANKTGQGKLSGLGQRVHDSPESSSQRGLHPASVLELRFRQYQGGQDTECEDLSLASLYFVSQEHPGVLALLISSYGDSHLSK